MALFSTDAAADALGLLSLRKQYRPQLGIAFVVACSMLLAQGVAAGWRLVKRARRRSKSDALLKKTLHSLTADEKTYLIPFVRGENTVHFRAEDGVVGGLVAKDILYRASNIGNMRSGFAYNLQPWAREYLTSKPHRLNGANPQPTGPPGW